MLWQFVVVVPKLFLLTGELKNYCWNFMKHCRCLDITMCNHSCQTERLRKVKFLAFITHSQREAYMVLVRNGASGLKISKQSNNSAYSLQSGPLSHVVWTDKILIFISLMVLNCTFREFKNFWTEHFQIFKKT